MVATPEVFLSCREKEEKPARALRWRSTSSPGVLKKFCADRPLLLGRKGEEKGGGGGKNRATGPDFPSIAMFRLGNLGSSNSGKSKQTVDSV